MAPRGDFYRSQEVPKTIFRLRWPGPRHNLTERRFFPRANPGAGSEIRSAGPNLYPFSSLGLSV
jgi:hypothetical protein